MECWKQFFSQTIWESPSIIYHCALHPKPLDWFKDFIYLNKCNCENFNFPMNFCMLLNMLSHALFIMVLCIYFPCHWIYFFSNGKTHIKKNYVLIRRFIRLCLQIWILMLCISQHSNVNTFPPNNQLTLKISFWK